MSNRLEMNMPAPDFELTDTQDRTVRLSDYRGKPVVLALLRGFM